ncbi:hypothetical protein [Streptomyces griseofuscus]|uniref:Uncharacterized protein n=1 Tax=Streptomyces griseofuscus TaxID=146922 RepID=A0A7H1Q3M0_9ACTN|nr:hypothetical protein [Streptomyces griseofuscus]QNT94900.1 hypothetical protein HEP81_04627 [Streptomyces griseofuscus]
MTGKYLETPERYGGEPLYGNLPDDYRQAERPFTVTVRGPERHDCSGRSGSATRYVLDACSTEKAWAAALAWHMAGEETPDCYVVADESYEGLPQGQHELGHVDLRPEHERRRGLDELADDATELLGRYDGLTGTYTRGDGRVPPEWQEAYDNTRRSFWRDGWGLVRQLASLDGR